MMARATEELIAELPDELTDKMTGELIEAIYSVSNLVLDLALQVGGCV
jgi:hypothetical protein